MQSAIRNPDHDTFLSSSRLLSILNRTFGTLSIMSHPVCTGMRTNSAELEGKYLFTHSFPAPSEDRNMYTGVYTVSI